MQKNLDATPCSLLRAPYSVLSHQYPWAIGDTRTVGKTFRVSCCIMIHCSEERHLRSNWHYPSLEPLKIHFSDAGRELRASIPRQRTCCGFALVPWSPTMARFRRIEAMASPLPCVSIWRFHGVVHCLPEEWEGRRIKEAVER